MARSGRVRCPASRVARQQSIQGGGVALVFAMDFVAKGYRKLMRNVGTSITSAYDQPVSGIVGAHYRTPGGSLLEIYNSLGAYRD